MTRSILLVRHASTEWTGVRWCSRTDLPLSRTGMAEALALAAMLSGEQLRQPSFLASPARRARGTAEVLAAPFGAPVVTEPDLREVDFGAVEGLTWEELCNAFPSIANAIAAGTAGIDWPRGEPAADLAGRARRAWERLASAGTAGDVVAVSHGAMIAAVLRLAAGDSHARVPHPASVVRLVEAGNRWEVHP